MNREKLKLKTDCEITCNSLLLHKDQGFVIVIFLIVFTLCFSFTTQAETIWKIGSSDNHNNTEFGLPNLDPNVIEYQVPENWDSRSIDDWKDFPGELRPPGSSICPKIVYILYNYSKDYRCPILRIRARSDRYYTQSLVVEKGGEEISEPNCGCEVGIYYTLFEFSIGPIQKGIDEENLITLKNCPRLDTKGILFDYLELDDQDEDGDGALDSEEYEGDTDGDNILDKQDPDSASILIQEKPLKRITLDIQEYEDTLPYFKGLAAIDQNSPNFPPVLIKDMFFPYGLFSVSINIPDECEEIFLKIIYPETIHKLGKFCIYNIDESWQQIPLEVVDGNCLSIHIKAESYIKTEIGLINGKEGQQNVITKNHEDIALTGGLAYPRSMNITLKDDGCFICSISSPPILSKLPIYFFIYLIIPFLLLLYFTVSAYIKDNLDQDNRDMKIISCFKKIMIILILLFCFILKASLTFAITLPDMRLNASPNPVGSGARALSIGGAFIAIADDATAASWNPAGLLRLKRPEVSVVVSCFSGKDTYETSSIKQEKGEIRDISDNQKNLNYLSCVFPFYLFQKNMVFSLNYQHLYEFSRDNFYKWIYLEDDPIFGTVVNISMTSNKKQRGSLNTFSPAMAINIGRLFLGLTANLWLDDELNNYWENINILNGEGVAPGGWIKTYAELYERYDFSGFNTNIGFLWQLEQHLTIGGVVKTSFKADIRHEYRIISMEEYPGNLALNIYSPPIFFIEDLTLKMPISLGFGASIRFSDRYLIALDIYHTKWQDFLLFNPKGERISPINKKLAYKADIKSTTQIRLGTEYLIIYPLPTVSLRSGIFYDPEPATGRVDDFYGISLGTGIVFKNWTFDLAYQYRFGKRREAEDMLGKIISSHVEQHYFYSSMIFYF